MFSPPRLVAPSRPLVTIMRPLAGFLLAGFLTLPCAAEDWNQWRGGSRSGKAKTHQPPQQLPEELRQVWRVRVGEGYSSPVVADERVFIHTRDGDREAVAAFRLSDGHQLWWGRYVAPFARNSYALAHGEGPFATPVVADGRLYTLGTSGMLSAIDTLSGKVLWRLDYSENVTSKKLFCGSAASPIVADGMLLAHLGDDRAGALIAFDAASGEERWRWTGSGPGYASPIVVDLAGVRQLVTLTSRSAIGLRLATGELLWSLPFTDEWNENIVSPIYHEGRLFFSGVRRGTLALKIFRQGEDFVVEQDWQRPDLPMYMSSPVIDGGILYGLTKRDKGRYFALDPRTGKSFWESEPRQADQAALIAVDQRLLILTDRGELLVTAQGRDQFRRLAGYSVADSATWTQPALVENGLLIKDSLHLTLLSWN